VANVKTGPGGIIEFGLLAGNLYTDRRRQRRIHDIHRRGEQADRNLRPQLRVG